MITPFFTSPERTGTEAHSHTGKTSPPNMAVKNPRPCLLGKTLTIKLPEIKTCSIEDITIHQKHKRKCLKEDA